MTLSVHLSHDFDGFALDVAFDAPAGVTVLFGHSGSGKTSVVNAVAGLLRPDAGRIAVGDWPLLDTSTGLHLPPHRRRLGYIFQEARLFPHLSVRQNLTYGARFAPPQASGTSFDHVTDMLGIGALLDRRPGALSGGERQRVAIGRALLAKPKLILADEPLAALDAARKAEILPFFERLRDEVSIPILYVTHSASEVARLATTVVALEAGRVLRQGSPTEVLGDPRLGGDPGTLGAVLEARITRHHDDGLTEVSAQGLPLFLPRLPQPVGTALRLRLPANEVILSRPRPEGLSALNILPGIVQDIRDTEGAHVVVSLNTRAGLILARLTRRSAQALALHPGETCHAVVKTLAIAARDVGGAR